MKIIKITIRKDETKIWYKKGLFKDKRTVIETAIQHLQRMLNAGIIDEN